MVNALKGTRQETGSYCGPAVIEMLLGALGRKVTQSEVVEASDAVKTVMKVGIPLVDLAKGVSKMFPELAIWEKYNSTVEDIKDLLSKGYAVAVDWQGIFSGDEYGDDEVDVLGDFVNRLRRLEPLKGSQGHYCIVTEVDIEKGFIKFLDPYGHYASRERFVAVWEFEERWWDDRFGLDENKKKKVIFENKLLFVISTDKDFVLESAGLKKV